MNNKISREDLSKDSTIKQLTDYMKQSTEDRFPDKKLSDYEQGYTYGKIEMLRFLEGICK